MLALERVLAVLEELGRRDVEGEGDVLAGREAGGLDRLDDEVEGRAVARQVGGEAALVAEAGGEALPSSAVAFSAWYTSAPQRRPSAKVSAPIGRIMNSWMSRPLSACAPPLMMFISGTGSTCAFGPPR